MKEPYRTLFDGYENHWLLGAYLWGDEPDWEGIAADDRLEGLSTGEKVFLDIACYFPSRLPLLDEDHRLQLAQAILLTCRS